MTETYYIVRQNATGTYLLGKPNKILFSTKDRREAEAAFTRMTDGQRVHSYDFNSGIYILLSAGHYVYHQKALYVIDTNVYPT